MSRMRNERAFAIPPLDRLWRRPRGAAETSLCLSQRDFAAALLDPLRPPPGDLGGPDGEPSAKRFGVYRNNVVLGLCETLGAAFPAVRRLVGEAFFMEMARAYALREPPASPVLLGYGGSFPDFIASYEPAAGLPYLAGVARIERGWAEAYHAEDAAPLSASAFASFGPEALARAALRLHPSLRVVRSDFPVVSIWRTNVADETPIPLDAASGGEDALILRPAAEVEVRLLSPGGAAFLAALDRGASIAGAALEAGAKSPHFDLGANLTGLIGAGAIIAIAADMEGADDVGA